MDSKIKEAVDRRFENQAYDANPEKRGFIWSVSFFLGTSSVFPVSLGFLYLFVSLCFAEWGSVLIGLLAFSLGLLIMGSDILYRRKVSRDAKAKQKKWLADHQEEKEEFTAGILAALPNLDPVKKLAFLESVFPREFRGDLA